MVSIDTQVIIVKLILSVFIFTICLITFWYSMAVYYSPESLFKAPLECITREMDSEKNQVHFWIDKLALLGAKREGSVLFWDDALDASFMMMSDSNNNNNNNNNDKNIEELLQRVVTKCSSSLAQESGNNNNKLRMMTVRKSSLSSLSSSSSDSSSMIWTIEIVSDHYQPETLIQSVVSLPTETATSIVRNIFSLHNFKMHLRLCTTTVPTGNKKMVKCPSMYYAPSTTTTTTTTSNNNNSNDKEYDTIQLSDILPLNKNTMISGAVTNAPRNIGNVLKQEFGDNWESELLLNFRRKERRV